MKPSTEKQVTESLSGYLGIQSDMLEKYYTELSEHKVFDSSYSGFLSVEKFRDVKLTQTAHSFWNEASLIGIDLPLYYKATQSKGTMVIIGIDPLRKRKDFPVSEGFSKGAVTIGTPYAFHSSFYTSKAGRTKAYYDFTKHVSSRSFNVYLTDIYKIWMSREKVNEKPYNMKTEFEHSKELLAKELKAIEPKAIICFGKTVEAFVDQMETNIPKIVLQHPSGANRNWNTLLEKPRTCAKKINMLNEMFDEESKRLL